MTDRQIIGWLLLKDLPLVNAGVQALKTISGYQWCWGDLTHTYPNEYMSLYPAFFLPIYEGEEVCPKCKGIADVYQLYGIRCPTCHGSCKITKAVEKPKWPPLAGQEIWAVDFNGNPTAMDIEHVSSNGFFYMRDDDYNYKWWKHECFPTRELAEEYIAWRKEKGLI